MVFITVVTISLRVMVGLIIIFIIRFGEWEAHILENAVCAGGLFNSITQFLKK